MQEQVRRVREESRPRLLEVRTYRFVGHSRSDPATYRAKGELDRWLARDPLLLARERLISGGAGPAELDRMTADVAASVRVATQEARTLLCPAWMRCSANLPAASAVPSLRTLPLVSASRDHTAPRRHPEPSRVSRSIDGPRATTTPASSAGWTTEARTPKANARTAFVLDDRPAALPGATSAVQTSPAWASTHHHASPDHRGLSARRQRGAPMGSAVRRGLLTDGARRVLLRRDPFDSRPPGPMPVPGPGGTAAGPRG